MWTAISGDAVVCVEANNKVFVNNQRVYLTLKEYQFLRCVASSNGATVTKQMFAAGMYPSGVTPDLEVLKVFACKIRGKLEKIHQDAPAVLKTIRGQGYAFGERIPALSEA